MNWFKYIAGFIGLILIGQLYQRYINKNKNNELTEQYDMVKNYLLNDSSLANAKKPILWIHVENGINARNWQSWGSRNTDCINQPYLYLTIKSIVDKCGESFNIVLINDDTFANILPGWTIDIRGVADPIKKYIRTLAISRVLYYYGGLLVPPSTICFQDLHNIPYRGLSCSDAIIGEYVDKSVSSSDVIYSPNTRFMGCLKGSEVMKEFCEHLELLISKDYTNESNFLGNCSNWWAQKVLEGKAGIVTAKELGVQIPSGPMNIEKLFGDTIYPLFPETTSVYIPEDDVLNRTKYQWFARQSPEQVLEGEYFIAILLLGALAPMCNNSECKN
jgi:hypothetical protein